MKNVTGSTLAVVFIPDKFVRLMFWAGSKAWSVSENTSDDPYAKIFFCPYQTFN